MLYKESKLIYFLALKAVYRVRCRSILRIRSVPNEVFGQVVKPGDVWWKLFEGIATKFCYWKAKVSKLKQKLIYIQQWRIICYKGENIWGSFLNQVEVFAICYCPWGQNNYPMTHWPTISWYGPLPSCLVPQVDQPLIMNGMMSNFWNTKMFLLLAQLVLWLPTCIIEGNYVIDNALTEYL